MCSSRLLMRRFGLIPATLTPMDKNFKVDYDQLGEYIRWLIKFNISGLAVNIDASEGPHLYPEEQIEILKTYVSIVRGKVPIIAGLHARNTEEAVRLGLEAKGAGADGLLVFPHPAFIGEPSADVIYNYHLEISEKVNLPMILFHLQPALGGVEFSAETLLKLVKIENIVAIREASFDAKKFVNIVRTLNSAPRKIMILTGNDIFIYESLILGAEGGLLGFGTIATDKQAEIFRLVSQRKFREAEEIWYELLPLVEVVFSPPVRNYRARLKEALVMMGILKTPYVRPPLQPISDGERKLIRRTLMDLGML